MRHPCDGYELTVTAMLCTSASLRQENSGPGVKNGHFLPAGPGETPEIITMCQIRCHDIRGHFLPRKKCAGIFAL
jgi:hypothetical protein